MSESWASMEDRGVPEPSAEEEVALTGRLTPEQLADYEALNLAGLVGVDAAPLVTTMRDLLIGEIRRLQGYVARVEAVLCECEPEREPRDYRQPAGYMHAAGCLVADLQQAEAVTR